MSIIYPTLVPLTFKAKQFKENEDEVKQRVAERFGVKVSQTSFDEILYEHKIADVFVMS